MVFFWGYVYDLSWFVYGFWGDDHGLFMVCLWFFGWCLWFVSGFLGGWLYGGVYDVFMVYLWFWGAVFMICLRLIYGLAGECLRFA